MDRDRTLIALRDAAALLSPDQPFRTVFEQGDLVSVELYAPIGQDSQSPHDRDELYIVASGTGTFSRAHELVSFTPGDLLYVPAYTPHRFESFSADFKVWVIFYGSAKAVD